MQADEAEQGKAQETILEMQKALDEQLQAAAVLSAQLTEAQEQAAAAAAVAQQQHDGLSCKLGMVTAALVRQTTTSDLSTQALESTKITGKFIFFRSISRPGYPV